MVIFPLSAVFVTIYTKYFLGGSGLPGATYGSRSWVKKFMLFARCAQEGIKALAGSPYLIYTGLKILPDRSSF